jgi:hypothetical protein
VTYLIRVTVETFKEEMAQAMKAYERYVICIDKTPEEFEASLISLVIKAINAFRARQAHDRDFKPERQPAPAVRHLFQSQLAVPETAFAQDGRAGHGTDRRRTPDFGRLIGPEFEPY